MAELKAKMDPADEDYKKTTGVPFGARRLVWSMYHVWNATRKDVMALVDIYTQDATIVPSLMRISALDTFDNMVGVREVTDNLRSSFVGPFMTPMAAPEVARTLLLYGPPGTGKTQVMRSMANEMTARLGPRSRVQVVTVDVADINTPMRGVVGKNIKAMFLVARAMTRPSNADDPTMVFLFMDEMESLVPSRAAGAGGDSGDTSGKEGVPVMLVELERMSEGLSDPLSTGITIFAGATNHPRAIDGAVLNRMKQRYFMDLPNHASRLSVAQAALCDYAARNAMITLAKPPAGQATEHDDLVYKALARALGVQPPVGPPPAGGAGDDEASSHAPPGLRYKVNDESCREPNLEPVYKAFNLAHAVSRGYVRFMPVAAVGESPIDVWGRKDPANLKPVRVKLGVRLEDRTSIPLDAWVEPYNVEGTGRRRDLWRKMDRIARDVAAVTGPARDQIAVLKSAAQGQLGGAVSEVAKTIWQELQATRWRNSDADLLWIDNRDRDDPTLRKNDKEIDGVFMYGGSFRDVGSIISQQFPTFNLQQLNATGLMAWDCASLKFYYVTRHLLPPGDYGSVDDTDQVMETNSLNILTTNDGKLHYVVVATMTNHIDKIVKTRRLNAALGVAGDGPTGAAEDQLITKFADALHDMTVGAMGQLTKMRDFIRTRRIAGDARAYEASVYYSITSTQPPAEFTRFMNKGQTDVGEAAAMEEATARAAPPAWVELLGALDVDAAAAAGTAASDDAADGAAADASRYPLVPYDPPLVRLTEGAGDRGVGTSVPLTY